MFIPILSPLITWAPIQGLVSFSQSSLVALPSLNSDYGWMIFLFVVFLSTLSCDTRLDRCALGVVCPSNVLKLLWLICYYLKFKICFFLIRNLSVSFSASVRWHLVYEDPGWFDAKGQAGSKRLPAFTLKRSGHFFIEYFSPSLAVSCDCHTTATPSAHRRLQSSNSNYTVFQDSVALPSFCLYFFPKTDDFFL